MARYYIKRRYIGTHADFAEYDEEGKKKRGLGRKLLKGALVAGAVGGTAYGAHRGIKAAHKASVRGKWSKKGGLRGTLAKGLKGYSRGEQKVKKAVGGAILGKEGRKAHAAKKSAKAIERNKARRAKKDLGVGNNLRGLDKLVGNTKEQRNAQKVDRRNAKNQAKRGQQRAAAEQGSYKKASKGMGTKGQAQLDKLRRAMGN